MIENLPSNQDRIKWLLHFIETNMKIDTKLSTHKNYQFSNRQIVIKFPLLLLLFTLYVKYKKYC